MKCKNCKTCKHHEFKTSTLNENVIVFAHYCKKFGSYANSYSKLLEEIKE